MLAELRSSQHDLYPASKPDWTVYGPARRPWASGCSASSALWASDPAMAAELAAAPGVGGERIHGGGVDGGSSGGGSSCGGGGCGGGGCGG